MFWFGINDYIFQYDSLIGEFLPQALNTRMRAILRCEVGGTEPDFALWGTEEARRERIDTVNVSEGRRAESRCGRRYRRKPPTCSTSGRETALPSRLGSTLRLRKRASHQLLTASLSCRFANLKCSRGVGRLGRRQQTGLARSRARNLGGKGRERRASGAGSGAYGPPRSGQ